jgi:hypothetical protein
MGECAHGCRTRSGSPREFAVYRGDRQTVDACFPAAHQAIAIEFSLLVVVRARNELTSSVPHGPVSSLSSCKSQAT